MSGLARQIALPGEFAPERFPSFPALERTAVMAFSAPSTVTLPAPTLTYPATKVMLSRQAAYPGWADTALAPQLHYTAGWVGGDPLNNATAGSAPIFPKVMYVASGGVGSVLGSPAVINDAGQPPVVGTASGSPVLGTDRTTGSSPYIYVPMGSRLIWSVVNINASGAPTVDAVNTIIININFERWTAPGEVTGYSESVFIANNTTGTIVGALTGISATNVWVRPTFFSCTKNGVVDISGFQFNAHVIMGNVSYTTSAVTAGTINVTQAAWVTPVPTLFPIVFPTEFYNSTLPWGATRTTAVSFLGTNVTQVLNKAGTILAGRVNPQINDPFNVTSATIQGLHPAEKAWLPLETGLYTYCPPSTDMSGFWDYTLSVAPQNSASPARTPLYRLDNDSLVNVAYLTAGSVAETLAVTVSWHIEFRTTSALFPIALSGMTLETLHQAQLALAAAGFFFHNPDHKAVLERVIKGVYQIAPIAMKALGAFNPAAAAAVATGHDVLKQMLGWGNRKVPVPQAPMKMPPTSAGGSGIVRNKNKKKKKVKVRQVSRSRSRGRSASRTRR